MKGEEGREATPQDRLERQQALRALLMQPLLLAGGDESQTRSFALVRRHTVWLSDWLAKYPGWGLLLDSEIARLRKTPADAGDGTRPARRPSSGEPFSRRRYALFCLALAVLERGDRQTALGQLADQIAALSAADQALAEAGMAFTCQTHDQRRDLVHAMDLLLEYGVLKRLHGNEEAFIGLQGDVLYNVNRPVLAVLLNVKRAPSSLPEHLSWKERLSELLQLHDGGSEPARLQAMRTGFFRRLLDDPAIYYADLSPEELGYLQGQRPLMQRLITEATGLVAEARREGLAMVDEQETLSDLKMPEPGTEGHVTLLLADYLAERRRVDSGVTVGLAELRRFTAGLMEAYGQHWRKAAREAGAEDDLVEAALERLEGLSLVRRSDDRVTPLPAIARYAVGEPLFMGKATT